MTIDRLLKGGDWTEEKLATLVGVDQSTINRIRRRKRTASLGLAMRIERATGGLIQAHELPLCRRAKADLRLIRPESPTVDASGDAAA